MQLSQLLMPFLDRISCPIVDCDLAHLANDSRTVAAGSVFIAYPGAAVDGRLFINDAIARGAIAVLYEPENLPETLVLPQSVPCIAFPHLAQSVALLAQQFYRNPSQHMVLTGITGTNGKTTIAYQLAQAHALLNNKSAYIGTIGQGAVDQLQPLENTTPDALCLQKLLASYQEQGVRQVCMEVSSHALTQHRVEGLAFKQAIFTNLTLDHLDYHHTMEEYAAAKAQLFAMPDLQTAILNADDAYHEIMRKALCPEVQVISYGFGLQCDVRVISWSSSMQGSIMEVRSPWGLHSIRVTSLGQFNVYNSLAVFASLMAYGYRVEEVIAVMGRLKAAPGRMELVTEKPSVLVDYAHTPDALDNVLKTLQPLKKGSLWVVFGCGGDRDKSKRPLMGEVASRYADKLIVTSDNPRSENPQQIIADIVKGIPASSPLVTLVLREEAIAYALEHAQQNDIILIAGKGHESYQQIGAIKHAFSDKQTVLQLRTHH